MKRELAMFKSKLEVRFADKLKALGWSYLYEPVKIPYTVPAKKRHYTPDFVIDIKSKRRIKESLTLDDLRGNMNYIVYETKGNFNKEERNKLTYVLETNPWLRERLYMVFPRDNYITARRKKKDPDAGQRYSDWCLKNNVQFFIGDNPSKDWFPQ